MSATVPGVQMAPAAQSAGTRISGAGGRFLSIDAFRGFIMILLVSEGFGLGVLRTHAGWSWLGNQFEHAAWTGCTLWDLIQPGFTFIVGASMPFALANRMAKGAGRWELFRHVAARSFLLILLSNVLSNFDATGKPVLQLINVLCQIAFGYFICFLIIQLRFRYQVLTAGLILSGYWALFVLFPGLDGPYSKTNNIGAVIDRAVLGYNYAGYYTTINFIGNAITILFGCWAGMLLQSGRPHSYKVKVLAGAGIAGILLGLAIEPFNPMIKHLWTLSFTLYSGGWVTLGLLAFYWIVEVKQHRDWTFPMIVVGTNCIFIYSFWQVLSGWLYHGIGVFTGSFWFLGDLGAIPQKTLTMCAMWYLCYWLYKRRIFFKI